VYTHPINNHGTIIYWTEKEFSRYQLLLWLAAVLSASGFAIALWKGIMPARWKKD
jgi:hypothetical protein